MVACRLKMSMLRDRRFLLGLVALLVCLVLYVINLQQTSRIYEQHIAVALQEDTRFYHNGVPDPEEKLEDIKYCDIYNISAPYKADFKCVNLKVEPWTPICLYDRWRDMYISNDLETTGIWEPKVLLDFKDILERDPSLGVIDIGANIGVYSLLAARMRHLVVAVEPFPESLHRFHRAAQMAESYSRIVLLRNAVAAVRTNATIRPSGDNQGDTKIVLGVEPCVGSCPQTVRTITMDDLLEVIPFKKAVLKMDCQGYEHHAMRRSGRLFDNVDIQYIFMEWLVMKDHFVAQNHTSANKVMVQDLLYSLLTRKYRPYSLDADGARALDPRKWHTWPSDVVWRHLPNDKEYAVILKNHFVHWPL